jgi:hypothetical protein
MVFSSKYTLQFFRNNFYYWIAGCLKCHVQNGIIIYVVAPYYNLVIHRILYFLIVVSLTLGLDPWLAQLVVH